MTGCFQIIHYFRETWLQWGDWILHFTGNVMMFFTDVIFLSVPKWLILEDTQRVHISTKLHCLHPDRNFKFHLCPESHIAYLYTCSNCVVIVAMTTHYNLASRNSLLLWRSQNIGNGVTFLYISPQPPLRSWTWLYWQKANETQIPMTYCPYGNVLNFSHTSRIHFSWTIPVPFKPMDWVHTDTELKT